MKIVSLFHQGPTKYVETFPVDQLTPDSIQTALAGSSSFNILTNPDGGKAINDLMAQREASLGWCRIWVMPDVGDFVEMHLFAIGGRVDVVEGEVVEEMFYADPTRVPPTYLVQTVAHGKVVWSTSGSTPKRVLVARWEQELAKMPPSCTCDWLDDRGNLVVECRVHPLPS